LQNKVNDIDARLTSLDNRVDPLFGRINNLELLYEKIDEFTLMNLHFTNGTGIDSYAQLQGTWYRPMILSDGGGSGLKFLILVVHAINVVLQMNFIRCWSDQLNLPIPPVNNNDFRVWNALNSPMQTKQVEYDFEINPGGIYRNGAKCLGSNQILGQIINDSSRFIVQYF
jgi:hypothetical protein